MDDCYNSIMKPKQSSNVSVMQKEHNKTVLLIVEGISLCLCRDEQKQGGKTALLYFTLKD